MADFKYWFGFILGPLIFTLSISESFFLISSKAYEGNFMVEDVCCSLLIKGKAKKAGLKFIAYRFKLSSKEIKVEKKINIIDDWL